MIKIILFSILCVGVVVNAKEEAGGERYRVVSVTPKTRDQVQFLKEIEATKDYDFWNPAVLNRDVDIMVRSNKFDQLKSLLMTHKLKFKTKISDVQSLLAQQAAENAQKRAASSKAVEWTSYHTFEEIESWLVNDVNASSVATVDTIGKSTEGRQLYRVIVSTGALSGGGAKPVIYMDANIHAREWITSAVATYIINELTLNTAAYTSLLDMFDFYIVPVLNPDGFAFTHVDPEDMNYRMWRKTRSVDANTGHIGVDANRNFPFFFGGESTSSDPSCDTYKGPAPLSEPETKALAEDITKVQGGEANRIYAYFTIHSYGQLWLLSWGFASNVVPRDYEDIYAWGKESAEAIYSVHQMNYTYGTGADLLYGVGGASDDWAKSIGIKYSTTLELRDNRRYGFLLPPEQILPTSEEVWKGIQVIGDVYKRDPNSVSGVTAIFAKQWLIAAQLLLLAKYLM